MDENQRKEIVALVVWLQTFPNFGPTICNDEKQAEAEELVETLGTARVTR